MSILIADGAPLAVVTAPVWTGAVIIDEDTLRLTSSAPIFFQPSKFAVPGTNPDSFVSGAYGFTLSLASQGTDEVIEVREIDWNSGFGTNTVDLTLNRKLWPDDVLTVAYTQGTHDFQNANGLVQNITGLTSTNTMTALIAEYRYVDPSGNDSADGLTTGTAWATWTKVETELPSLADNTAILFKRGETWTDVAIDVDDSNMWFGAYGTGARPIIDNSSYSSGDSALRVGFGGSVTNVRIAGFKYEGVEDPASTSAGGRFVGFSSGNVSNSYVSHSYVNKGWNSILTLKGGSGLEYVGIEAHDSANSGLWMGGNKTSLLSNCIMRDCIAIKDATYAEEDGLVMHAESDSSGSTPMNYYSNSVLQVGTGNKVLRCYSRAGASSAAEQAYDNTYGEGNEIKDCYFYNAKSSGSAVTVGWSGNAASFEGCYIEGKLGISAWRDATLKNCIFKCGTMILFRSKYETDGNNVGFDPSPSYTLQNISAVLDDSHPSYSFCMGFVADNNTTYGTLNVGNVAVHSENRNQYFVDYTAGTLHVDLDTHAGFTWDRVKFWGERNANFVFARHQAGNTSLTFSEWVAAEGATNCEKLDSDSSSPDPTLFTASAYANFSSYADYAPNSSGALWDAGGLGSEVDFYSGKARNTASDPLAVGAVQPGISYTSA